jgi:transmembrane sensor
MNRQETEDLFERYARGETSDYETKLVEIWLIRQAPVEEPLSEPDFDVVRQTILDNIYRNKNTRKIRIYRYAAAATILVAMSIGLYTYLRPEKTGTRPDLQTLSAKNDIAPGKNTATLTLASGKTFKLSDAKTGVVIAAAIQYNDGSKVTGSPPLAEKDQLQMLTASTPRGGTYQVELPDGTHVWLNAATTLKFPSSFTQNAERRVELSGEAYFEVAKDKAHPFIVTTSQQSVKVLGTHFNINAYDEEPAVKTTLLEGAVEVTAGLRNMTNPRRVLRPGQQAALTQSGQLSVYDADAALAVAWKNSQFMFDNDRIEVIMRMVQRWYNVDVKYVGDLPDEKFDGEVSRYEHVSEILKTLEATGKIHFKIEGRTIYVSK